MSHIFPIISLEEYFYPNRFYDLPSLAKQIHKAYVETKMVAELTISFTTIRLPKLRLSIGVVIRNLLAPTGACTAGTIPIREILLLTR